MMQWKRVLLVPQTFHLLFLYQNEHLHYHPSVKSLQNYLVNSKRSSAPSPKQLNSQKHGGE